MAGERPCAVCLHPDRLSIDQAVLNGKGLRAIARDFNIGSGEPGTETFKADHKKVQRHRDRCMAEAYKAAREADKERSGAALVNRMLELDQAVDEVLRRSREGAPVFDADGRAVLNPNTGMPVLAYSDRLILAAVQQARRNTEMRAKLAGLDTGQDDDTLAIQRARLSDAKARRLLTELDELTAQADQELTRP